MKDLTITPPKGFEIDTELSDLSKGIIKFKEIPKITAYNDVADKLIRGKNAYYIGDNGKIKEIHTVISSHYDNNMSTNREQLEAILALNKLCNVAEYLNDGWKPTFDGIENNHALFIEGMQIKVTYWKHSKYNLIYFKTKELALKAIEILGEEEVKKSLGFYL